MKRQEKESFEEYKKRRKEEQKKTKEMLKGRLVWLSKVEGPAERNKLRFRCLELEKEVNKVKEVVTNGEKA